MEKVLNVLNLTLFIISYIILIVPTFIILLIADAAKKTGLVKLFDTGMRNFEE